MDKYEYRRQRLLELKDTACNGTVSSLADKLGRSASYVSRMLYSEDNPNRKRIGDDMLDVIAQAFGVTKAWLDGEDLNPPQFQSKEEGQDEEIVTLIHKNIFVGCGGGAVNDDFPEIIRRLDVPRKNLTLLFPGLDVENLTLVGIKGDSMEPTLPKRGLAFVDERIRHFDGDGIYAFFYDDGDGGSSYMKRLQKVPGRLIAHSDNPKYSAFDIKPDDPFQIAAKFVAVLPLKIVLL